MKRRTFITLLGGAAAAWPLAARGQQADRVRRIGVLTVFSKDDPEGQRRVAALLQKLQELGWTDGRNVRIEFRWGGGDPDRSRFYAGELVGMKPDVILVNNNKHACCQSPRRSAGTAMFRLLHDRSQAGKLDRRSRL